MPKCTDHNPYKFAIIGALPVEEHKFSTNFANHLVHPKKLPFLKYLATIYIHSFYYNGLEGYQSK
jgi:hypothetical protein